MQENWIGKSRGLQFCFRLAGTAPGGACDIEVFTTRPDTIFGASFVAISPGHPIAEALAEERSEAAAFIAKCAGRRHQRGGHRDRRETGLRHRP